MRPLLQIKLPREPPACDYHESYSNLSTRNVYIYMYGTASGEKRSENQMPVVLDIGFIAVARTTRCDREWKRLTSRENGGATSERSVATAITSCVILGWPTDSRNKNWNTCLFVTVKWYLYAEWWHDCEILIPGRNNSFSLILKYVFLDFLHNITHHDSIIKFVF